MTFGIYLLGLELTMTFRLLAVIVALSIQPTATEKGWTNLFNGKDFTGWKIRRSRIRSTSRTAQSWRTGLPSHCFYDGPVRAHTFRNFELMVDVMTRAGSNGGVFIMTEYQEQGWPEPGLRGAGQQHLPSRSGEDREPVSRGVDVDEPPAKDDEWSSERIIVKGDAISDRG